MCSGESSLIAKIKELEMQKAEQDTAMGLLRARLARADKLAADLESNIKECAVCLQLPTLPVVVCPCMKQICAPCMGYQGSIVNRPRYGPDHSGFPTATLAHPVCDQYKCPTCRKSSTKQEIERMNCEMARAFFYEAYAFVRPQPTKCPTCKDFTHSDPRILALHTAFCYEAPVACPYCNVQVRPGQVTRHLNEVCASFRCDLPGCIRDQGVRMTGDQLRIHHRVHQRERLLAAQLGRAPEGALAEMQAVLDSTELMAGSGQVGVVYLSLRPTYAVVDDRRGVAAMPPSPLTETPPSSPGFIPETPSPDSFQ